MAGMPKTIVERANDILEQLEQKRRELEASRNANLQDSGINARNYGYRSFSWREEALSVAADALLGAFFD